MINQDILFEEIKSNIARYCSGGQDTNDLVRVAESVIDQKIKAVSVPPEAVGVLWTWLERAPTKLLARFNLVGTNKNGCRELQISDLSEQINTVFKQGADGAQVFMHYIDLAAFASDLHAIRDDLFFNKDLSIGLNISEIEPFDWSDVFTQLNKINATTLLLGTSDGQTDAQFLGRVYGLLESWKNTFDGELHFALKNDVTKIEGAWRLVQKMRPELSQKVRFFINN